MKVLQSLLVWAVLLLSANQAFSQKLQYTVDLRNTEQQQAHVNLKLEKLSAKTVSFQMPLWAPGAYSVTGYGRYVKGLRAYDTKGKELLVTQVNDNRWEVKNGKSVARFEYDVLDSHKDTTSLYFAMAHFDTSIVFANATTLFGYVNDRKNVPATVTYLKPEGWQFATALDPVGKLEPNFQHTVFQAKDYDELADAPLMAAPSFQTRSFQYGPANYDIVLLSNKDFEMDSLSYYTKKIVESQVKFFNETPFKHYTFLIYAPTLLKLPSLAQGALEHANSSDYLMMNISWEHFKTFGLRIISHEFFHLWNVKRIHSSLLGPFDYTKQVRTTSLWLSEGVTDYYAHALLARNKIITPENFLRDIEGWYVTSLHAPSGKSLEQLSQEESDFNLENATTFYTKGPLVGLMLDLEIRNRTENKKSLDDVMLALNAEAKKGKHFKDEELMPKIEKIVGLDLSDFYKRYITGTDSIPVEQYLTLMGIEHSANSAEASKTSIKLGLSPEGRIVLEELDAKSFFAKSGLHQGDELDSVDGVQLRVDNIDILSNHHEGDTVQFSIIRSGAHITIPVVIQPDYSPQEEESGPAFILSPKSTALQTLIRKSIIGS